MPVTVDEVRDILFIPMVFPFIVIIPLVISLWFSIFKNLLRRKLTIKNFLFETIFALVLMWGGWEYGNMIIRDYINAQVNITVGYVERSSAGSGGLHRSIHVENHNFSFIQSSKSPEVRSGITYRIYYTPQIRIIIRAVPIN